MTTHTPRKGSMGLRGIWDQVGNATAMVCVCVAFFWMLRMYEQGMRDILRQSERRFEMSQEQNRDSNARIVRAMDRWSDKLEKLCAEFRQVVVETRGAP